MIKKATVVLTLCMLLIASVSWEAFANPISNIVSKQFLNTSSVAKTSSQPLMNSHNVQSEQNMNVPTMNPKDNMAVNSSRWSKFKSRFHERVIQPIQLGWAHIKSNWRKEKASPKK